MSDTITSLTVLERFVGNNSTVTPYPLDIQYSESTHIKLLVDGVNEAGFTIAVDGLRTTVAVPNTSELTVYRATPRTQLTDFPANTTPSAADLAAAVNKLTLQVQELSVNGLLPNRSLTFPINEDPTFLTEIPTAENRLGKIPYFNLATGELEFLTAAELALVVDPAFEALAENIQLKHVAKSANFTAENDGCYIATATCTVADPTPVEGKGYTVFVRAGTTTINSVAYSVAGTIIRRIYQSATWVSYVYLNKAQLDTTYATVAQGALADSALQDGDAITVGAAVTASGTSVDFTGIPSWAKRIIIHVSGVSLNTANDNLRFQLGISSGIQATNYFGAASQVNHAAASSVINGTNNGCDTIHTAATAGSSWRGEVVIDKRDDAANSWTFSGALVNTTSPSSMTNFAVSKSLVGTLDRVRITTVSGTSTFDAGEFSISYE